YARKFEQKHDKFGYYFMAIDRFIQDTHNIATACDLIDRGPD
ncbi:13098_t:CDS:1, partial [Gigaspora rosea]